MKNPTELLVVEDDPAVLRLITSNLERAGFAVSEVTRGDEVVERVLEELPALIVLDVMLPKLSGFEICRILKANVRTNRIPIIMLTAKALEPDRVHGLELGADDYVTKPFSPRELVLRVKAEIRKAPALRKEGDTLQLGEIFLDRAERSVQVSGLPLGLTRTEFKLLALLLERVGRVQTRDRLLTDVWGYANPIESRTVDIYVTRLRGKLGVAASHLETVRGFGYRMVETPAK